MNFVQFDKWEHERFGRGERNNRKCLQPDPDHCGRSPSTMSMDFKRLVEASSAFFARKFDSKNPSSMRLRDEIDTMRAHMAAHPWNPEGIGKERVVTKGHCWPGDILSASDYTKLDELA
eukprot:gene13711-29161_t